jgi:ribosomal protein S4E
MMAGEQAEGDFVIDGDDCVVTGGSHAGKCGVVEDRRTSKTGHVNITVRTADGARFKTLAKNVMKRTIAS